MTLNTRLLIRISAACLVAVVAACAPVPGPLNGQGDAVFRSKPAIEVFSAGYGAIADKFVHPVAFSELATEGLRGLQTVDPDVSVETKAGRLVLNYAGRVITTHPVPERDDVEAWAKTTFNLAALARVVSPDLAAMDAEKIYEAVFDAALTKLDRFSRYSGAIEAAQNRASRDGYSGIGVRFRMIDTGALITMSEAESPASELGLRAGDVITHIDGYAVKELTSEIVKQRLRGPENTTVMLVIARPAVEKKLAYSVQRTRIVQPTVTVRRDSGTLIIAIARFNQNTATSLSRAVKTEFAQGKHPIGIILDLRGNPGGLLKQAILVADLFIRNGRLISTEGRHPDSIQHYFADDLDISHGTPMIVLVDGRSASAAEILAATLEDRGRALVVGSATYGKGTVQTVIPLPNNGEMTLTWSRFVAPSGYVPHGLGVIPTLCTSAAIAETEMSGLRATAGLVLARLNPTLTKATSRIWRATSADDTAARIELRAECPPRSEANHLTLTISKLLLMDKAAYYRYLAALNDAGDVAESKD